MHEIFKIIWLLSFSAALGILIGCTGVGSEKGTAVPNPTTVRDMMLTLPDLAAVNLEGSRLQVVASTSLVGDVVAQVGGEAIDLTTLMAAGQDPHSYEPGAQELTAVAQADVIFVNGWDLEEALVKDLETIGGNVPVVAISANIEPLILNEANNEEEGEPKPVEIDPHVWFNIQNVAQWTENVAQVLTDLNPAKAIAFRNNAEAYLAELSVLETDVLEQLAKLPIESRVLVTNHNSFSYFAQAYDFEILGTVLPGNSTIAEPSASDLIDLITIMEARGVCTIFTETTTSDNLSQTVAAEVDGCDTVQVVQLYTDAVGAPGSGVNSYIDMFRANVAAIVAGLK